MTAASSVADVSTAAVLWRAAAAEWTRLWTLRSTWFAVLTGAGLMLFIAAAAASGHDGAEPAPIWQPVQIALVPAQFAFLLAVLLPVTGEYATGAIRSTVQWVPRRGLVLLTRTVVPVVFVTACAVVAAGASLLVAALSVPAPEVVAGDIAASLARVALVVAFGGVLTVGLGLLLRSTAGTLTALFLLMFALVVTLGNTGVPWLIAISDHLPGRAVVATLVFDEVELPAGTIATVITVWSMGALLAGGWSLLRRDTA